MVDTSVAVKWVVPESDAKREANTDAALRLLEQGLLAPDCILGEFANALFKKVRRQEIGSEQAIASLEILPDIVRCIPTPPLVMPALQLALQLGHPVHDCIFLIAAETFGIDLITADAKFFASCQAAERTLPIRLLEDR